MRIFLISFFAIFILTSCSSNVEKKVLVNYVIPIIGTASSSTISAIKHGNGSENNAQVIPEVTTPFGMTNWTPQTQNVEKKCIAPYYYRD